MPQLLWFLSGYGALLIILQQEGQLFSMPKVTGHPFSLVAAGKSILFLEKGKMDKDYEKNKINRYAVYREVVEEEE